MVNEEVFTATPIKIRKLGYPLSLIGICTVFFTSLIRLFELSSKNEIYSQILLVPFLSIFFVLRETKNIHLSPKPAVFPGILVSVSGIAVFLFSRCIDNVKYPIISLDFSIISFLLIIIGVTHVFFGSIIFEKTIFGWLLLLLMIPLPSKMVSLIITFFQYGSAEVVDIILGLSGMNYIREKLTFHLPSISIFIAQECSGIRSSTALLITALLGGHLFLSTFSGKICLFLSVIPLTLLKNGIRISTLTILAERVDTAWLTDSDLHHHGGIVFFALILVLLFGFLFAIRILEKRTSKNTIRRPAGTE